MVLTFWLLLQIVIVCLCVFMRFSSKWLLKLSNKWLRIFFKLLFVFQCNLKVVQAVIAFRHNFFIAVQVEASVFGKGCEAEQMYTDYNYMIL